MRPYLIFVLLLTTGPLFGQNFTYPTIRKTGASIKDFVPSGWTILDSATGDLNNDKLSDAVLILQHVDSVMLITTEDDFTDTVLTRPRILAVLFKDASDSLFCLKEQSNTFILTHDDPYADDPYQATTIKKGILQIDFYWYPNSGSWFNSTVYRFRYQEDSFLLIGAEYEERNKATHDYTKYSYDFLAKKRTLTKGNDFKKGIKTEIKSLNVDKLKTIKTLVQPYSLVAENGIEL